MPTEHNPETNSTKLKRMIIGQSVEGTAIPMVLFSSDTLAVAEGGPAGRPEVVAHAAAGLDIDLDTLGLFTVDAYRLQSALGEGLAPPGRPAPIDEGPAALGGSQAPLGGGPAPLGDGTAR